MSAVKPPVIFTLWLVTRALLKKVEVPYAVVVPYSTCDVDGLSVVQVIVTPLAVILLEATLEMMTLAAWVATLILNCFVADFWGVDLSVALTVKVEVPIAVGVPEMFEPEIERPAGNAPEDTDQAYGAVPPVADTV